MSKQVVNPEYLRRNLMVCKAVGANANAKTALKRLKAQRRPAKWLVAYLEGIIDRTEGLPNELACYRAVVPNYLPVRAEGADQIVAEIMDGIESSAPQHSGAPADDAATRNFKAGYCEHGQLPEQCGFGCSKGGRT